jgi:hypothetical protein
MMKYSIYLLLIVVFESCFPRVTPVKQTYVDPPFETTSTLTKDLAFNKILSLFSQKSIPVKVKDISNGLIVSGKSVLSTTIEDRAGKLTNKSAWIVVPSVYNASTNKLNAQHKGKILGEWSITIKQTPKGTLVQVSLLNLTNQFEAYKIGTQEVSASFAKSTGVFEKLIADIVK